MAYLINRSDGTVLATVSDGQVDSLSTDLTFIGKNYSGFGESLNENFVKLLENFAGASRPSRPIRGQIWFDSTELKLKVYNGTAFQPVSSATISAQQPTTLTPGDLWFNDTDKQLYFYDGINTLLLGPTYAASQGLSGFKVSTILDTLNQSKVITSLYNNGTLVGIFSSATTSFTPKIAIAGFTGAIGPGFNPGAIEGFKYNVTATNAENLGEVPYTSYVRNDKLTSEEQSVTGRVILRNGLEVGLARQVQLFEVNGDLLLQNVSENKFVRIAIKGGTGQNDALVIGPGDLSPRTATIFGNYIDSETLIGGNLTVNGNLNVLGERVYIDVADLRVENKNIELGVKSDSSRLTDDEADQGGVILRGSDDKEWLWSKARDAWNSSENINLEPNCYYAIDGVPLIEKVGDIFRLTEAVTQAQGIEIFGTQAQWTVDNLFMNGNTLSTLSGNLLLEPATGSDIELVGSPQIKNVGEPSNISDAATKNYVDTQDRLRPIVVSMDITDGISNAGIASYLEQLAPVSEYSNNTVARVLCTVFTNLTTDIDLNANLNESTDTFNTPTGTAEALIDVSFSTLTIPGAAVNINRLVKTFQIVGGAWTFVS